MPLSLKGSTSGYVTLNVPAVAGANTVTVPAITDTLVGLVATQTLTNKTLSSPTITGTPVGLSGMLLRAPQVITTGTTYTTPANCNLIMVMGFGGGGGGGGGGRYTGLTENPSSGIGGGAGASFQAFIPVSPSTSYLCAIGLGGNGGAGRSTTGTGSSGTSGGSTSITINGTQYLATGGRYGLGGLSTSNQTGDSPGGVATPTASFLFYGDGGTGVSSVGATQESGFYFGNGGAVDTNGTGYGAGGGGGSKLQGGSGSSGTGGDGADGGLIIWEYS